MERDSNELMDRTARTWKSYFIMSLLYLAYISFSINMKYDIRGIIFIIIAIIQLIISINIARLFSRCKVELES